jgi:hypothetical protein
MPAMKLLPHIFYSLGIALQFLCVGVLFKRKLHREYRFFTYFLVFQVLSSAFLEPLSYTMARKVFYFYAYWVQTALSDIFAIAVFYELFCAAFKPFPGLRDMAQIVFRWAAVALVLVAVVLFCSSALPSMQRAAMLVVNTERSVCVMQCGLLLFLFMGSGYLGLSKRSHVFGLSLGFGIMAMMNLIFLTITSVTSYSDGRVDHIIDLAQSLIGLLVQSIWLVYLATPEPARAAINVPVTSPLLRWNEVALALGHSGGRVAFIEQPDSFMPNVERIVEEVMKRDMFVDHH